MTKKYYSELFMTRAAKIMERALKINATTEHTVFVSYSGHVDELKLDVYKNGWAPRQKSISINVYGFVDIQSKQYILSAVREKFQKLNAMEMLLTELEQDVRVEPGIIPTEGLPSIGEFAEKIAMGEKSADGNYVLVIDGYPVEGAYLTRLLRPLEYFDEIKEYVDYFQAPEMQFIFVQEL